MSDRIIINSGRNGGKKTVTDRPDIIGKPRGSDGALPDASGDPRSGSALKDGSDRPEASAGSIDQMPLDEDVWGGDREISKKIDEGLLADRRLFVRIRHIQKVLCSVEYADAAAKEPLELDRPLEFMIIDLSVSGIGIISEYEIERGKLLGIRMLLDGMPYDIKCEVVYCIWLNGKYRAGFRIVQKDKKFMRHLKIFVARVSLTNEYASGE